jgi:hypothetical protein
MIDNNQEYRDQRKPRRWGTRLEAMAYAKLGSTTMNELMHSRRIVAKKQGTKVLVDLDSLDDYLDALPDVGAADWRNSQSEPA